MVLFSKILWTLGSSVLVIFAGAHLYLTFFTKAFWPKDKALKTHLENTQTQFSPQFTFWEGWIGFNASHSLGLIFIGLVNIFGILKYYYIFQNDPLIFVFNAIFLCAYALVAYKYWFNSPLFGLFFCMICYSIVALLWWVF